MKIDYVRPRTRNKPEPVPTVPMLLLFFIFLSGTALGRFTVEKASAEVVIHYSPHRYIAIWQAVQYAIPVCISMFSNLGLTVIPVVTALRGYNLCVTAMIMHKTVGFEAAIPTYLISSGVQLIGLYCLLQYALITCTGNLCRKSFVRTNEHRNRFVRILVILITTTLLSFIIESTFF